MSHTTGKLAANGDWIGRETGGIVAIIGGFDDATNEANANRLVACWNALDGLTQDALEGGWTAAGISQYAKRLEEERDELLTALLYAYNFLQGSQNNPEKIDLCLRIGALFAKYKEAE